MESYDNLMEQSQKLQKLNAKLYYFYKKSKGKNKRFPFVSRTDFNYTELLSCLDIPQNTNIYIHADIKNLKLITNHSYEFIFENLIASLNELYKPKAIFIPTFTPSFRSSGIYCKRYSRSEYGIFSEIARKKCEFRTNDAIHSVGIFNQNSEYVDKVNFRDTFCEQGLYSWLSSNCINLNIGTHEFVATYLHYIEETEAVPYKLKGGKTFDGIMYDDERCMMEVKQINHFYEYPVEWNRQKIVTCLKNAGVLKSRIHCGIEITQVKFSDLDNVIRKKLKYNSYYLVTF